MIEELSIWLKGSIPGIILLGAVGSILAVVLTRIFFVLIGQVIPLPYRFHRKNQIKQAFFLGFAAANIEHDKTGKKLQAYLAFHMCMLMIALFSLTFFISLFSILLAFQSQIALTISLFISITTAFLCIYWAYFEFEYIYRTYLFFWKAPMAAAIKGFEKRESRQEHQPKSVEAK